MGSGGESRDEYLGHRSLISVHAPQLKIETVGVFTSFRPIESGNVQRGYIAEQFSIILHASSVADVSSWR